MMWRVNWYNFQKELPKNQEKRKKFVKISFFTQRTVSVVDFLGFTRKLYLTLSHSHLCWLHTTHLGFIILPGAQGKYIPLNLSTSYRQAGNDLYRSNFVFKYLDLDLLLKAMGVQAGASQHSDN